MLGTVAGVAGLWLRALLFRPQLDHKTQLHGSVRSIVQSMPVETSDNEGRFVGRRRGFQDERYAVVCVALNVLEQQSHRAIEIAPIRSSKTYVLCFALGRYSGLCARAWLRKRNEDAHC